MSAPISPGARTRAERNGLGEHRDQQRALRVRGCRDRRADRADCRRSRASARSRSSSRRRSRRRCPRWPSDRAAGARFVARHVRERRADVGVLRMQAAGEHRLASRRVTRCAISIASPQAVEPSYIEALATSMPGQRRDLGLELEQHLQRALARSPADRACSWSGIPSAGSDDRRSPGRGGDRRRRRERTAPIPPRRCAPAIARACARPRFRSWRSGISSRPASRLSAGMSANSASMSATPIRASIAVRSVGRAADSA